MKSHLAHDGRDEGRLAGAHGARHSDQLTRPRLCSLIELIASALGAPLKSADSVAHAQRLH
jgi:hypothetical protein